MHLLFSLHFISVFLHIHGAYWVNDQFTTSTQVEGVNKLDVIRQSHLSIDPVWFGSVQSLVGCQLACLNQLEEV